MWAAAATRAAGGFVALSLTSIQSFQRLLSLSARERLIFGSTARIAALALYEFWHLLQLCCLAG
jgi:hypothetical protein